MAILNIDQVPEDVFRSLNVMQQNRLRSGGVIPLNLNYYDAIRQGGGLGTLQPSLIGAGAVPRGNLQQTRSATPQKFGQLGAGAMPVHQQGEMVNLLGGISVPLEDVNATPTTTFGAPGVVAGPAPTVSPSTAMPVRGGRVSPSAIGALTEDRTPFAPGMDVSRPGRIGSVGGANSSLMGRQNMVDLMSNNPNIRKQVFGGPLGDLARAFFPNTDKDLSL